MSGADFVHDFILLDHAELRHRGELVLADICGKIPLHGVHLCQGRNGSGKSTFLRAVVGIHPVFKGAIVNPLDRTRIAYLPQFSSVERDFPITVGEFIALGSFGRENAALAREATDVLEISNLTERPLAQLSGGQFQKVLLARVHVQDAPLVVLDEPFNFLDERAFGGIVELMRRWNQRQKAVIVAAHAHDLGSLPLASKIRTIDHHVEFSTIELRALTDVKESRDLPVSRK